MVKHLVTHWPSGYSNPRFCWRTIKLFLKRFSPASSFQVNMRPIPTKNSPNTHKLQPYFSLLDGDSSFLKLLMFNLLTSGHRCNHASKLWDGFWRVWHVRVCKYPAGCFAEMGTRIYMQKRLVTTQTKYVFKRIEQLPRDCPNLMS